MLVILGGSVGLAIVTLAFAISRLGSDWAVYPFWLGMLTIFVPAAVVLLRTEATRGTRVGVVVWLALALYLVKILHSPSLLDFYDELQHWRTASDIVGGQALFTDNPLLLTSSLFPGLEIVTSSLVQLTGSPIDGAGLLVIAVARVMLVLALFLVFERVSRSSRTAGIATLVYAMNPSFLFFDAQFAYESMALSLSAFVLLLLVLRADPDSRSRVGLTIAAIAGLAALMVTHHLTSYAFAALLILWSLAGLVTRGYRASMGVGSMSLIGLVLVLAWLGYVASVTVGYLVAPVGGAIVSFLRLILREEQGRALFQAATTSGIVAPTWERMLGFGAAGLIVIALPIGAIWLWRAAADRSSIGARIRSTDPLVLTLIVISAGYPATLALRFTSRGAEISSRAASTLFIAVGLTVAMAVTGLLLRTATWRRVVIATVAASIVFMGNVVVGWPPWQRLPGPMLIGADSRSINGESLALAEWARDVLGAGQRFGADRTNTLLLGSHGEQFIVWYQSSGVDLSPLWYATELGPDELARIRDSGLAYLVVDHRLSTALPQTGVYFDGFEVSEGPHGTPIADALLAKFDSIAGVRRVFDSGQIQVYDLGGIADAG